jgi:peptide/nickel transport system ATP-binding protein
MDLIAASEEQRRALWGSRIAYVAQSAAASFNPAHHIIDQTVETAVAHNIMTREKAEADARDLYKRLQLPNPNTIGDRFPHQVSGGQLQRAMTAMAMSCRPDLIILTDHRARCDHTGRGAAAMRDIVEQFNTAAIYITHDLAVVAQMADRIMVLLRGKVERHHAPMKPRPRTIPDALGGAARQGNRSATTSRCASTTWMPATAAWSRCWTM